MADTVLCRCWHQWFVDGRQRCGLVSNAGTSVVCATKLDICSGLDDALCGDGGSRLACVAVAGIRFPELGDWVVPVPARVEFCVVTNLFSQSRNRCRAGGDCFALVCDCRNATCFPPD